MITWNTPQGSLGTKKERETTSITLLATSDVSAVAYTLIAGSLPRGLRLIDNAIKGSPSEVKSYTTSRFVIRAQDSNDLEDRTFSLSVDGADAPEWITKEGYLQVGTGEAYFVLDNSRVNFQLESYDADVIAGDKLEYYLVPMGGQLPPGLSLSRSGVISGFTDPIFAIDYNASLNGGYDTGAFDVTPIDFVEAKSNGFDDYFYDNVTYDYSEPSRSPKRLSRSYSFVIAVTDGATVVRQSFKIYVVTEEFLTADNSIVQISTNVFTADASSDRVPLWISDSNLGRYRSNNYVTLFLDVYDPPSLPGTITYFLLPTNNNGSPSVPPPGLELDSVTGELAGVVPYQSKISKTYSFTVEAVNFPSTLYSSGYTLVGNWNTSINYSPNQAVKYLNYIYICTKENRAIIPTNTTYWTKGVSSAAKTFNVEIVGEIESAVRWVSNESLGTIRPNQPSQLFVEANTVLYGGRANYKKISGDLPIGLELLSDGKIQGKVKQFADAAGPGLTRFFEGTGAPPPPPPPTGRGHNPLRPLVNSVAQPFGRYGPARYADGIYTIVPGVNPRTISNIVVAGHGEDPDPTGFSGWLYAWGQFLTHDLEFAREGTINIDVIVPSGDTGLTPGSHIPVRRNAVALGTGPGTTVPATAINETTGWLDSSVVYGIAYPPGVPQGPTAFANPVTLREGGRIATTGKLLTSSNGLYPPKNISGRYFVGDPRGTENPDLLSCHVLMIRDHNWHVDRISAMHPEVDGERLYQRAKSLVIAEMQKITYDEWLPKIVGPIPEWTAFNPNIDATIKIEFSAAALRFGHSIVSNALDRIDESGNVTEALMLANAFFLTPAQFERNGGADGFMRKLAADVSNKLDVHIVDDLRNLLDDPPAALDLAATNIQRGRDLGLGTLNQTRTAIGLTPYTAWSQITSDVALQTALSTAYGNINDVDLWIGGLAENRIAGAMVGETFRTILVDQFIRLRDGDSFYWKNQTWALEDLVLLQNTTLAGLILRNTNTVRIQPDVFVAVERADLYNGTVTPATPINPPPPPQLSFDMIFDGDTTTFDRKFTFTVEASDASGFSKIQRTFYFTVTTDADKTFSNLYLKAFQSKEKRLAWSNFITDANIFKPSDLYRPGDINFGVQTELKMLLFAGIESTAAEKYVSAMGHNHYRKQILFGDIKTAKARDPDTQETIYEVVYVDIKDDLEKEYYVPIVLDPALYILGARLVGRQSISNVVELPDNINSPVLVSTSDIKIDSDVPLASDRDHQRIFPNSIYNMRNRLSDIGERDRTFLPLWMRSIQDDASYETGYVKGLILCYTLPNKSQDVVARIQAKTNYASRGDWSGTVAYQINDSVIYAGNYWTCIKENSNTAPFVGIYWIENFNFSNINFTADRYLIDILDGEIEAKYLAFPQRGEKLP